MAHQPLRLLASPTYQDIDVLQLGCGPLIEDSVVMKNAVAPLSELLDALCGGLVRFPHARQRKRPDQNPSGS